MSIYRKKLLELKSIEYESDKYFLHTRLSFEQDIDVSWEIDEYTAENLKAVIQFDRNYKYRLSFNSAWDMIHKQHLGKLTQTYCEQSEQISFLCSDDYINKITTIKQVQDVHNLDKLIFIYDNATPDDKPQEAVEEPNQGITFKKDVFKFKWSSVAVMSIIFIILFGYLSHLILNKSIFDKDVLAQSIQSDEIVIKEDESLNSMGGIIIEDISYEQPIIPLIDLEEIAYTLPKGSVALTFDDGPSQFTMNIIDVLNEYDVGATFFFVGNNAKKYPDYVRNTHSSGYSIGSHSMSHTKMRGLYNEKLDIELVQSVKLLEEIIDDEVILFRPPYGSFSKQIKDLIYENNYKMVLWNNDPRDWATLDADMIFNDIQNTQVSGSIILLHESQAVIDALPRIIEYLKEQDLQIVNLK